VGTCERGITWATEKWGRKGGKFHHSFEKRSSAEKRIQMERVISLRKRKARHKRLRGGAQEWRIRHPCVADGENKFFRRGMALAPLQGPLGSILGGKGEGDV